jgi:hypothetical protein
MKLSPFLYTILCSCFLSLHSQAKTLGDLNGDGVVNLLDTVLMVNHIQGTEFITNSEVLKWQADVNGDGLVNSFDVEDSLEFVFKREPQKKMPLSSVLSTSPYDGEGDIALTREFVVRFNMPLKEGTVITPEMFYATSSGSLQVTSARLSSDRMKATLFLNGFRWPSNSNVTITLDGTSLTDFMDRPLDVDGDGNEGGIGVWTFSTLAVEASDPSTIVKGRVLDSDNSDGETPLEGVIVSVVGNEEQWTVLTDANGYFRLSSAPIGRFFVVVDGRLVSGQPGETLASNNWRERDYYTFVGKAWEAVPGKEVNATKYGTYNEDGSYNSDPRDGNIYLPLVKKGALQTLNPNEETEVAFAAGYLDEASPEQMAMLEATSITIPPGSLQSDDGTTGGSVGIAPVAPDRLPEPLPESLAMPLVITIQTDGPTNFDVPVPARFPNVDNLPPGAKSALWSFDHDTGVWEISGPMTVSEDGKYLESDPGVGIRQPGWHGSAPGAQIFGKAVTTGSSINQPKQDTCGVSHANMDLTENEFTSIGRLSEGIEESVFGANDDEISFAGQILTGGSSFTSGKNLSGTSWDLFRKYVHEDAKLHSSIARTASSLLGSDDFWNAFATTATTMRDNAISASIDSSKHSTITQAHLLFLQKLEKTQLSVADQLEKWGQYSIALNGLTGPTSGISGHSVIQTDREELTSAIDVTLQAYRALPGGRNRLDGHLKRFAEAWEAFLQTTLNGNLHAYNGESFVFLKRIGSEREENRTPPIAAQRIRVGQGGAYDAIVRPNSWYEAWMLEPTTLSIGCTTFISPQNGGNGPVPPIALCTDNQGDSDYDYLSDRGERVVGTHKNNKDTDGDKIPDGYEILNGTDPSGGNPVFTGVLATIPPTTSGAFSDFVTTGNDLAILGNGPHGLDIFEIGSGFRPIKLSSFDTPGSVRKAALTQDYLAVADAGAGLTVLNITDPENPSLHLSIAQDSPANAVATAGKIAFVGLENGTINSYDLFSGQQIDQVTLSSTVEDISYHDSNVFALLNDDFWFSSLHSIPTKNGRFSDDNGPFLPRNSINTAGPRQWGLENGLGRRLFVGDDFAYVTDLMGFNWIDLSEPSTPTLGNRIKTSSRGWRHVVANGSGLAIAIKHQNSPAFATADPDVYTVQKNGNFFRSGGESENLETSFPTAGNAGAVSIYNGLAYVADGSLGLQVVNYRSYDINKTSPELEVTLDDMEGNVEEAKFLTLRAFVFDDVQVKNVDFFVDGEKVFVDGGYPFAHTLEVPLRKDQATLRLRVIARDTGGNEAYWPGPAATDEKILEIRDDLIAPEVVTYIPREGETVFPADTVITIFNERMDPETIHARSIRLYEVNEDNSLSAVELESVQYDDATQSAYAQLPEGIKPASYKLIANELATDLAGNPLVSPAPERTFYGPGELKGKLWFDLNHNTLHDDNEETLSDWTVYLDYNNNGERDPGEPNATTDESGQYTFSSLLPGGYAVAEEVPYGWVQTFPKNQSLGTEEVFTNMGWVYEGDNHGGSTIALDTLGNAWTAGVVPEGNFTIGDTFFDGNNTEGILYIARIAPTGQVDRVETLGVPDGNNTGIASNLLLQADQDGGVWLSGAYEGSLLAVNGISLDSNNTPASFLARFNQDFNATYLHSFPGVSITSLSSDLDGRLALAGTFNGDVSLDDHSLSSAGEEDAFIAKIASTGNVLWAGSLGGDTDETAESVYIDKTGNTWIAGDSDSADFAASSNNLDLSGDAGGYLALYNAEGENLWAIDPVGGLSVTDDSTGAWFLDQNGSNDVVKFVDTNGTIQATFTVSGASVGVPGMRSKNLIATEDGNALVCLNTPSGHITVNGETVMSGIDNQTSLAKLKTNGQIAWSLPITTGSSFLWSLARGSDEYVWALGSVSGSAGETLSLGEYSVSLSGSTGILLKVDPTGEVAGLWSTAPASEVLVDPNDNVWITGTYQGDAGQEHTLTIGQLSLTGEAASSRFLGRIGKAGSDYHSVQLNPGSVISDLDFGNSLPLIETRTAMCIGGPDEDASRSVVTDPAGNGYYAGDFTGYTEFGGKRLESDGQNDAMFVKFLPGGKIAWAQNFGGDGDDLGHAIFADDNGSLFACGTFQGTAQFGDFELVSAGMRDLFVLRLDDNGSPLWAFRAGGPEDDDALALVADSNDSIYIGGSIQETADFGDYQLQSQGSQDGYVLHLDYNGSVQWVASFMSHDRAEVRTLTLDQNKLPVVAGDFASVLELRGTGEADDQASYFSFSGEDTASEDTNEVTDQTFTITVGVYSLSEGEYVDTGRILTFDSHEECQVWSRSATADEHSDETHDHWNAAGDVFYDEINRTFTWTEYGPELDASTVEELCINKTDGVTKTIDENTYYQDKTNLYLRITSIVSNDDQAEDSYSNLTVNKSWTFTNAGAEGRLGPSQEQINSAYLGTNLEGQVDTHIDDEIVTGIQEWIIPQNGIYQVKAAGAQGGTQLYENHFLGGLGAEISGNFELSKGSKILILVGQQGENTRIDSEDNAAPGGGGGTYIWLHEESSPLVVAGGGAGGGRTSNDGIHGSSGEAGQASIDTYSIPGNNGEGGGTNHTNPSNYYAGSGAGWYSDGTGGGNSEANSYISGGYGAEGGRSPLNGGYGGIRYNDTNDEGGDGGFGGGGGGGSDNMGTGGGGGYSGGGGAGGSGENYTGGGGGSYNSGIEQENIAGINQGHGKVVISLLGNPKLESAGQTDIFVARLDANGEVLESTQGAGTGIDSVNGIALGKYDEFYLTGVYGPALELGETSTSGDSTIVNAFHAQLDNNLSTQWISTVGGGGFNRGESVAVDTKGRAYFVGSYTGTAHFEEKSLTARGGADAYLVEYDYRGNVLRLISHGGDAGDAGTAIALDNNGGIIMTGTYQQEAHIFDGEHICHEHGGTDVFVARYDYGIQEPETHFVVEVIEDDNGTEIILINDEPAPTLELIPGLEYTFELDTNTTEEHPFVIVEEGDGGSDLWEVEEDVNQTENIITIKIDEDTPIDLGYGSETEEGLGGEIEVKQDPKPSYRLTIAQYDDGSNNVDGADIRVFKNGQEVSLDEPFEEGTRLRVQLDPSDEFIFEGWQGDLPADANRSFSQDRTFVVTMDQDRTLKAYFSTLSPDDPRDFLDSIEFFIQAKEVDEFGQETGGSKPPYAIVFEVDREGISEDGTSGSITIVSNGPDFDEPADGVSDRVEGRFIFEQTNEAEGVFQIVEARAKLSSTNQWSQIWGGGMDMSILFRKDGATSGEAGQFVMIKNDGTTEQGDWDADEIREDFTLNEN